MECFFHATETVPVIHCQTAAFADLLAPSFSPSTKDALNFTHAYQQCPMVSSISGRSSAKSSIQPHGFSANPPPPLNLQMRVYHSLLQLPSAKTQYSERFSRHIGKGEFSRGCYGYWPHFCSLSHSLRRLPVEHSGDLCWL